MAKVDDIGKSMITLSQIQQQRGQQLMKLEEKMHSIFQDTER